MQNQKKENLCNEKNFLFASFHSKFLIIKTLFTLKDHF